MFVFGDSIVQGFYDPHGGWVQHLQNVLHTVSLGNLLNKNAGEDYEVFNLGVSGDTAAGVTKRLASEIVARRLYPVDGKDIVVLAVGINDAVLRNNRAAIDVYVFQQEYEKAVEQAKRLDARVVCLGLTAVDEKQTDPWFGSSSGKQWKNNRINLFEDTIKQSSERLDVEFVGLHDDFLQRLHHGDELLADGLHPNHAGHQFIYSRIGKILRSNSD